MIGTFYLIGVPLGLLILVRLYIRLTTYRFKIQENLKAKTICITGCTSGIGKVVCTELARHGAVVYMLCPTLTIADDIKRTLFNPNVIHVLRCDLSSFKSIRRCVSEMVNYDVGVDILINAAEIAGNDPSMYCVTEDGLNRTMQINYFGHFLLTNLLWRRRLLNRNARIINVASQCHYSFDDFDLNDLNYEDQTRADKPLRLFAWSKFAVIMFTRRLAQKIDGTGTTINCVHSGIIPRSSDRSLNLRTMIKSAISILFRTLFKNPSEGIQTILYLALSPDVQNVSGHYFENSTFKPPLLMALSEKLTDGLWLKSLEIAELEDLPDPVYD